MLFGLALGQHRFLGPVAPIGLLVTRRTLTSAGAEGSRVYGQGIESGAATPLKTPPENGCRAAAGLAVPRGSPAHDESDRQHGLRLGARVAVALEQRLRAARDLLCPVPGHVDLRRALN